MPDEKTTEDVEKVLSDIKSVEDRKQALIADLLRQREAAMQEFDAKLAKLGYKGKTAEGATKRTHHKKVAAAGNAPKKTAPPAEGSGKPNTPTVPRRRR
jgi:hypothetical protein